MKKKKSVFFTVFFLTITVFFSYLASADYCRQLQFNLNKTKYVTVSFNNGIYEITITDWAPYIHTTGLDFSYSANEYYTLSFDYKTSDQVTDLQIFYYDPDNISEADSLYLNSLPVTSNAWRTHNITFNSANWKEAKHFLAATYDAAGGSGNLKIYLNGVLENSSSNIGNITVNNNPLYIGKRTTNYFAGIIDKVSIYDDVLSGDEIEDSYTHGEERAPAVKVSTTGTDAYVRTMALGSYDPAVYHTLAFEYKSTTGINDLQVFYNSGSELEANSKHCGAFSAAASWTTCSFDLSGANWGQYQRLRLDLGSEPNKDIQLKNVRRLPDDNAQWSSWTAAKKNNLNVVDLTDMVGNLPLTYSNQTTILTASEDWEGDGSELGVTVVKNTHGLNPDNKYYMFYAQHEPPSGIGCAVADSITGPYVKLKVLQPSRDDSRVLVAPTGDAGNHYSSPCVVWDEVERRYNMYFHFWSSEYHLGLGHQKTALAICYDLSSFNWQNTGKVVMPAGGEWWINSQSTYNYAAKLPNSEWLVALRGIGGKYINEAFTQDIGRIGFGSSTDGVTWNYHEDSPTIHPLDGGQGDTGVYWPLFIGYLGKGEYQVGWSESAYYDSNQRIMLGRTRDNFHSFDRDARGYASWSLADGPWSVLREGNKLYVSAGTKLFTVSVPTQ